MLTIDKYINLLSSLHWGQLIKFKWFFEEELNESLHLAPFDESEIIKQNSAALDVQSLFTLYFQEGQQNQLESGEPLIELYKKEGDQYIAIRKLVRETNLSFPNLKELRKFKPSANKEPIEV